MPSPLRYELVKSDATTRARLGRVTTPHGSFDTPAFMPVGTVGSVKGIQPAQVRDTGAQMILANTYHLMLRPGSELVAKMGGLQKWTRWQGPMLTDSGGYQVFSLGHINKISDDGVTFKSHIDGSTIHLTPAMSMRVQNELGADIIMAFDDCPPAHDEAVKDPARLVKACDRTARWLEACIDAHQRKNDQALFGIVQGGTDPAMRTRCVEQTCRHDLPGYAIGGVAVGEPPEVIETIVEHTAPRLPGDRPRYLMGVGYERDILAAVRAGVDMFDCVLPTRNGRNAYAFTSTGPIRLRNAKYALDPAVLDERCDCPACGGGFSRSYLRHLFMAGEMLGPVLVSLHNLRHFQRYLLDIRAAIAHNDWSLVARNWPVVADRF
ncbi:MAG: tRNA guanosine(34) transglycosylase Tgt [Phycisphaera sp.]|nr:tRNA guanosine(34) transglycosylase Tgt [Phycisphaera sp.]